MISGTVLPATAAPYGVVIQDCLLYLCSCLCALLQVGRVQHMINNEPASALGGQMTRSQALFGEPNQRVLLASGEYIAQLLGSGRYAGVCEAMQQGGSIQLDSVSGEAADSGSELERCLRASLLRLNSLSTACPCAPASIVHLCRTSTEDGSLQAAGDSPAAPATRTAGRRATRAPITGRKRSTAEADLAEDAELAELAAVAAQDGTAAPAMRSKRAASGRLLAVLALEHQLQDEDDVLPMRRLPQRTTAASSPAGQRRNRIAALAAAAAAAAAAEVDAEGAATAGAETSAAAVAAAEQEDGEGGAAAAMAAHPPMPAHLMATRSQVAAAHVKNRERIAAQRRPAGEPKNFSVGDAVLLVPQKCGKVGKAVGPRRLVCRVVAVTKPFGGTMYRLRSNAGVVEGQHSAVRMRSAPPSSASKLNFTGTDWQGLRKVSVKAAMAAQPGAGTAPVRCSCRNGCGPNCGCRRSNALCGRHCGCVTGNGRSCTNH